MSSPTRARSPRPAATPAALAAVVERLRGASRLALDTEADSLHHHFEKVCLIQISHGGEDFLVDPLADLDLSALLRVLADKPLILHGADYDLRMLRASFDFQPRGEVFDTMLAAQLLGFQQIGLAAIAERFLGVTLCKQSQRSNWAQRPLTPRQIQYAMDDTRHLGAIADSLGSELRRLGRVEWHRETCQRVVEATAQPRERDPDLVWRIRGAGRLKRHELAHLRELWRWRDGEAQRVDRPAFKIIGNEPLLELATWAVAHPNASLEKGPKLPRHCTGRRLAALRHAIEQARDLPEAEWPERRRIQRGPRTDDCRPLIDALRAEGARVAKELDIEPSVLAPRAALEAIARSRPQTTEDILACDSLMRWQVEQLGPGILRAVAQIDA